MSASGLVHSQNGQREGVLTVHRRVSGAYTQKQLSHESVVPFSCAKGVVGFHAKLQVLHPVGSHEGSPLPRDELRPLIRVHQVRMPNVGGHPALQISPLYGLGRLPLGQNVAALKRVSLSTT